MTCSRLLSWQVEETKPKWQLSRATETVGFTDAQQGLGGNGSSRAEGKLPSQRSVSSRHLHVPVRGWRGVSLLLRDKLKSEKPGEQGSY